MNSAKIAPVKPAISIEILNKIDIRVGTIELVEEVPGSEKLVRLTVDFGDHKRRILAGMKRERSNPSRKSPSSAGNGECGFTLMRCRRSGRFRSAGAI